MEYEHNPDFEGIRFSTRNEIIDNVVLKWPGACLDGRMTTARHMIDNALDDVDIFEYICRHHPHAHATFLERCGWRIKPEPEPEPLDPQIGQWLEDASRPRHMLVVAREGTYPLVHSHPSIRTGDESWVAYYEPGDLYVKWDRLSTLERIGCKVIPAPEIVWPSDAIGANTPPYRADYTEAVDWVWDRETLSAMGIPAYAYTAYEDGQLVRLWCAPNSMNFTCEAWGRQVRQGERYWSWDRAPRPWA
jgi:hypothetical protein